MACLKSFLNSGKISFGIVICAESTEVLCSFLVIGFDLLESVAEADRVHPLLTRAIASEHLLLQAIVVWVIWLTADTVELVGIIEVIILWRQDVQGVLRTYDVYTFSRAINELVRMYLETGRVRPLQECQFNCINL